MKNSAKSCLCKKARACASSVSLQPPQGPAPQPPLGPVPQRLCVLPLSVRPRGGTPTEADELRRVPSRSPRGRLRSV